MMDNIEYLESSSADYVVIAPSHFIYTQDFNQLVEEHIKAKNDITVLYQIVNNADNNFVMCDALDIDKKGRIKGIFLTHGHDENIGALPDIIGDLNNVPIYGSKYTLDIVKNEFEKFKLKQNNLKELKAYTPIEIKGIKVFPVNLSHVTPDNFGYAIYTKDGVIFYASDFEIIYSEEPLYGGFVCEYKDGEIALSKYKTDIGKLAYIGKQKVLCLLTESYYAGVPGFTSPKHRISGLIKESLNNSDGRIIFNTLETHLYRIQELFSEVEKTDRKIIIMGKRLKKIIDESQENNYLSFNKDIIGDLNNINDKNVVILIASEKEKPYHNIMRIVNGYDKFIKLTEDDTVFLATPIYENIEKTFYSLIDDISKTGAEVVTLSSKKYLSHHASREDLMTMINLMNPKYYFPIRGEYKNQVQNAEVATLSGIPDENILLKENGDVVTFVKGELKENFDKVPCGEILIDGNSSDDIGEVVLKDREILSNNGIMIISVTLNKKTKEIISGPEILTRGFVYVKDSYELISEIKRISEEIIKQNTNGMKYIEYNKIKNTIRDELSKYLINQTGNKPMIITVMQEI